MARRVAVVTTVALVVAVLVILIAHHRRSAPADPTAYARREFEPARCFQPSENGPFVRPQAPGHGCSPCLGQLTSVASLLDEAHFTLYVPRGGGVRAARLGWACGGRGPDSPVALEYANHIDVVVSAAPVGATVVGRHDATVLGVPAHAAPRPANGLSSIVELDKARSEIVVSDDGSHPLPDVIAFADRLVALPHYYRLFPWAW